MEEDEEAAGSVVGMMLAISVRGWGCGEVNVPGRRVGGELAAKGLLLLPILDELFDLKDVVFEVEFEFLRENLLLSEPRIGILVLVEDGVFAKEEALCTHGDVSSKKDI